MPSPMDDPPRFEAVYVPPRWPEPMEGHGWIAVVEQPLGTPVGVLWWNGGSGLGVYPAAGDARANAKGIRMMILLGRASTEGLSAREVWEYWTSRVSAGLAVREPREVDDLAVMVRRVATSLR